MLDLLFPSRRMSTGPVMDADWLSVFEGILGRKTKSGIYVNEDVALNFSACWCATRVISETIAMLPLFLYEKQAGDSREFATSHNLYELVRSAPNPEMGSMAWREGRICHQVLSGNAFSEIEWDNPIPERRKRVVAIWPIHPSRVDAVCETSHPDEYKEGYRYYVRNDDGSAVLMRDDEVLHIPGAINEDGRWGRGVIQYARESIGSALATEQHVSVSFGPGSQPRAILSMPGMKDPNQRKQFRTEWKEVHGRADASDVGIIPTEATLLNTTQFSNEDAQFLSTRQHNSTEIARWFRIPPHMLMDLTRSTYSNIETQSIEFVVYSLMPWVRRWEEQLNLKLLLPHERGRYYFEHQLAGLLRGDTKSRFEAYMVALQNGIMSVNECRRLENLNPVPGGDKHFVQLNMTTLENAGEPQQQQVTTSPSRDDEMTQAMDRLTSRFASVVEQQGQVYTAAIQSLPVPVIHVATAPVQVAAPNVHFLATVDVPTPEVHVQAPSVTVIAPPVEVAAPSVSVQPPHVSVIAPVDVQVQAPTPEQSPVETPNQASLPREAIRVVLEDVLGRMLAREGTESLVKAKSPAFAHWLEEFHRDHRDRLLEALPPAIGLMQLLSRNEIRVAHVADYILEWSKSQLLKAYEMDTRSQFNARLRSWSSQSSSLAQEILHIFTEGGG